MNRVVVVVALLASWTSACATPAAALVVQQPREPLAVVDVDVVDGTGGTALHHQDVVVVGDRIASVASMTLASGVDRARQTLDSRLSGACRAIVAESR